jgi:hypothetical protein
MAEGTGPATALPVGAYPSDKLRRRSADVVAFETPSDHDGMGTASRLARNGDPIGGVAIMDDRNDAIVLVVRVPTELRDLGATIIDSTEREAPRKVEE